MTQIEFTTLLKRLRVDKHLICRDRILNQVNKLTRTHPFINY